MPFPFRFAYRRELGDILYFFEVGSDKFRQD